MKALRYAFILLCLSFMANTASAQLMLGGGVAYGTDVEEIAIQVRGVYSFNETWRGQADVTYYLDGVEDVSFYEINLNGNYVFSDTGTALFYALAGLSIGVANVDLGPFGSASGSDTGINLGAGGNFALGGGGTMLFGEAKYTLGGFEQLVLAAGVLFSL
ncbi:MAG: hypothetical protein AAF544_10275 [Bacteroidota bacterium]